MKVVLLSEVVEFEKREVGSKVTFVRLVSIIWQRDV